MTDVTVMNEGSIVAFRINTKEAKEWFKENVQAEGWQWMGSSLCVDPRYAEGLIEGIGEAGLSIG
jgi:hypothetical protein